MKLIIAVPCMDMVHTLFFRSFAGLRLPHGSEVVISTSSLIYDARNQLARKAVEGGYDRVLWLDSDMVFNPDMVDWNMFPGFSSPAARRCACAHMTCAEW